jgi:hypothetical protein
MSGGPPRIEPARDVKAHDDSDTVARARAQLAAAEAEARRRAEGPSTSSGGESPETPEAAPPRSRKTRMSEIDDAVTAILAGLRDMTLEPQFRETLRHRAMRHLPLEEPEAQPWVALGLTRDVWLKLKKAGKLKED